MAVAAEAKLEVATLTDVAAEQGWTLHDNAAQAVEAGGYAWSDMFWGFIPGSAGETSTFCCLLGALILIVTGIGSWRTIFSGLLGLLAASGLMMAFLGDLNGVGSLA